MRVAGMPRSSEPERASAPSRRWQHLNVLGRRRLSGNLGFGADLAAGMRLVAGEDVDHL
jgi:hypothetical protein